MSGSLSSSARNAPKSSGCAPRGTGPRRWAMRYWVRREPTGTPPEALVARLVVFPRPTRWRGLLFWVAMLVSPSSQVAPTTSERRQAGDKRSDRYHTAVAFIGTRQRRVVLTVRVRCGRFLDDRDAFGE